MIQQAYVEGVSTRRVDDLVKALGCEGISKSQVSRICQELDVVVDGFLGRPLDGGPYPYLPPIITSSRKLSVRGLSGVELVVSDAHQGLRGAIAAVFGGASWQRCRTHFMTNLLTRVPRRAQPWVATMVRTIYQQPSPMRYTPNSDLSASVPRVASLLDEAGPDILAFSSFPGKKIWSNNPLERAR